MIHGHGDDITDSRLVRVNMSSNVLTHPDHSGLFAHLAETMGDVCHYPEASPSSLEAEIARRHGVQPGEVMVTNGATEAIYLVAQAFRGAHSFVMTPTFSEYADAARMHGHRVTNLSLASSLSLGGEESAIVWICNPNNPTGSVMPKDELRDMIEENPNALFVLDQSYEHFTREPLFGIAEAVEMHNVVLLHSMTKHFCVPGLRIGYVTACPSLLDAIRQMRMPWSVNQVAVSAAGYLLRHRTDYAFDLDALLAERERVAEALERMRVVEVYPSQSHILLCRLRIGKAQALKEYLLEHHGILIRYAGNFHGLDDTHFRIAVQQHREDNDAFLSAFAEWMMA